MDRRGLKTSLTFYLHARGHYHETYRKEDDGKWYIASIHLTRTVIETRGDESGWP